MTVIEPTAVDTSRWGGRHAHDPTAVRDDDGAYWLFSTDAYCDGELPRSGVQIRRSEDLVTWEFFGWAFDGVPEEAGLWSGATGLWAPEVIRHGDEWRMYYSASTFGSRTSAIGLATGPHPSGPWLDHGIVVRSRHHEPGPNAIDAAVTSDTAGGQWLVYGSFFAGIHMLELDPASGRPRPHTGPGVLISRRREEVEGAVEGAFIIPRPGGGHALLESYDSLARTYHVRAAVADRVTGPYRDALGHAMTDLGPRPDLVGTTILAGHRLTGGRPLLAPGHASVLTEPGRQLLVHHVRDGDDPTQHEVQVRRLVWTHGGWPLVSPQPWAGGREVDDESTWPTDPAALLGHWEIVTFDHGDRMAVSREVALLTLPEEVEAHGSGRFSARRGGTRADVVVFPSWDAVRGRAALSFALLDDHGVVTAGTRVGD